MSDLHFGRIHSDTLSHLEDFFRINRKDIKLAIVTGDLTQRAKRIEFEAAREFISSLEAPLFVVPGNHDVPLYNLFLRFFSPYKKFLRYVGPYAQNFYEDEDVAVFGLWTVDNFAVETGLIREEDLIDIENRFKNVPASKIKIIASHHPLLSIRHPRIKKHLERIMNLHPHLFLWGHEHQSLVQSITKDSTFPMVVASGTTTSNRTRNEANSFNYLTFYNNSLKIEVFRHSGLLKSFELIDMKEFTMTSSKSFSL